LQVFFHFMLNQNWKTRYFISNEFNICSYETPALPPAPETTPITQKSIETRSHDTAINKSPIPAFFKIFNPSPNFLSSPAAVTILNPPQSKSTKVINPSIPRIQLMAFLTTCIKESLAVPLLVPLTPWIPFVYSLFNPNLPFGTSWGTEFALTKAKLEEAISPSPIIKVAIFLIIFL